MDELPEQLVWSKSQIATVLVVGKNPLIATQLGF